MSLTVARAEPSIAGVGDYFELMKPRRQQANVWLLDLYLFLLFAMLLVDRMAGGSPLWGHLPAGA